MAYPFVEHLDGFSNLKQRPSSDLRWKARTSKHSQRLKTKPKTSWMKPKVSMEMLEPRYLLSADILPFAMGTDGDADDLSLRAAIDQADGQNYVQIVDNLDGSIVDQRLLQQTTGIHITGSQFNDRLKVELDSFIPFSLPQGISFDAGVGDDVLELIGTGFNADTLIDFLGDLGEDSLIGPDAATDYLIDGVNSGSMSGEVDGTFSDIENIQAGSEADTFKLTSTGMLDGTIDGGAGDDTLTGADIDNEWSIDGFDSGSVNGVDFTDVQNLMGGAADDTFRFIGDGAISGVIDGGAGNNTFDYSQSNGDKQINLAAGLASNTGSFASINELVGSLGNDTLLGTNTSNNWQVTELDGGQVNGFRFSGVENLEGGKAEDSFVIGLDGAITGFITGGLGADELNAADENNIWQIDGEDSGDLNGFVFTDFENLIGGDLDDAFLFASAGLVSGTLSGRAGNDRVRAADKANQWKISSSKTGDLNGIKFDGIETLEGGTAADTLIGPDLDTTWNVTGTNAGNVVDTSFTSMEYLQGAADNEDVFILHSGASVTGYLEGGDGGFDTVEVEDNSTEQVYTPTAPDAGAITVDGKTTYYQGFEPVVITNPSVAGSTITFDLTGLADQQFKLSHVGGNQYKLESLTGTIEEHTFNDPGASGTIIINLAGGAETLILDDLTNLDAEIEVNGGDGDDVIELLGSTWGNLSLNLGAGTADNIDLSGFAGEISLDVDASNNLVITDIANGSTISLANAVKDSLDNIVGADFDINLTDDAEQLLSALDGMVDLFDQLASLNELDAALPLIIKGTEVSIAKVLNFVEAMDTMRAQLEAFITETIADASAITSDDLIDFFNGINGLGDYSLAHLGAVIEASKIVDGIDLSGNSYEFELTVTRIINEVEQVANLTIDGLGNALADLDAVVIAVNGKLDALGETGVRAVNQAGRLVFQVLEDSGIKEMTLQAANAITETVLGVSQTLQELTDIDDILKGLGDLTLDIGDLVNLGVEIVNGLPTLVFNLDFNASRESSFEFDFGSDVVDLGLDLGLGGSIDAIMDLIAKFDLNLGLTSTDAVADIDVDEISAGVQIQGGTDNVAGLNAQLGFLAVELDGTVSMDARGELTLNDTHLSAGELSNIILSDLLSGSGLVFTGFNGTGTPSFTVDLTISVDADAGSIAGLSGTAKLTAMGTDLFTDRNISLTVDADFDTYFAGFNNLTAADYAGLLGQISDFIGSLGDTALADLAIPFLDATVGDLIDLQERFADKLLFNDGDTEYAVSKTLLGDINSALTQAGLAGSIRAESHDGNTIVFVAEDPRISEFKIDNVSDSDQIGITGLVSSTDGVGVNEGLLLASAGAAVSTYRLGTYDDDGNPLTGSDATFRIQVDGGEWVEVTLSQDDAKDNKAVGFGQAGLLFGNNNATFSTAQELAQRLNAILGLPLTYNPVDQSLTYDFSLNDVLFDGALPVDFELPAEFDLDLAPLAEIDSVSNLDVEATGELSLTLGVSLAESPANSGSTIEGITPLTELNGGDGVDTKNIQSIAAQIGLSDFSPESDISFSISIDGGGAVDVELPINDGANDIYNGVETAGNTSIFDLLRDINKALEVAGLDSQIQVVSAADKLLFEAIDENINAFSITTNSDAAAALGLAVGTTPSNSDDLLIQTHDGNQARLSLNGMTTLQQVIDALSGVANVTASINGDGTGVEIRDASIGGSVFSISGLNGSKAVFDLRIVGMEGTEDTNGDAVLDEEFDGYGIIRGGQIGGVTLQDRFFVEDASFAGTITVDGSIAAEALFGNFVGISLNGTADIDASISGGLKSFGGNVGDRVNLTTLLKYISDPDTVEEVVELPVLNGSAELDLDVATSPDLSSLIALGANPNINLSIADLSAPEIIVQMTDLDDLLKFDSPELNFSSVLDGLLALSDFLEDFEGFGFLNQQIPVLNLSINDMLNYADKLDAAIAEAMADPAATLQSLELKLEEAFGIGADKLNLLLDSINGLGDILKFDLTLDTTFVDSVGISIPEIDIPVLGDVLDLAGAADLGVTGDLSMVLSLGIDLANPGNIYLYDGTGLSATIDANASDVEFMAALGPLGLFIKNGSVDFTGELFAGIDLGGDLAKLASDLVLGTDLDYGIDLDLDVDLPTFFPTDAIGIGSFGIDFDLADVALDTFDISSYITLPDFSNIDLESIGLFDSILLAVDGVDLFLEGLQNVFNGALANFELPVIGDQLSAGADFIQDFRDGFFAQFRNFIETSQDLANNFTDAELNQVSGLLFDLLGPDGLNLLKLLDLDDSGNSDVKNAAAGDAGDSSVDDFIRLTTDESGYVQWDFTIGGTTSAGTNIDFDFGIPGLGLETEGDVGLEFEWDLDLGFGLSTEQGFYLNVEDENELTVALLANLPNTLTGRLGILQLTAEDYQNPGDSLVDLGLAFAVDINEKSATGDDAKLLGMAEFGGLNFDMGVAAEAYADLLLELGLNTELFGLGADVAAGIPDIEAEFIFDWSVGDVDFDNVENSTFVAIDEVGNPFSSDYLHQVAFYDVSLDLGSFLSDVLGPIVGQVQDITQPIQPIIDIITTPLPVLDDLGLSITLLDLAEAYSKGKFDAGMIYSIAEIVSFINSIPDPDEVGSLMINFGDFIIIDNLSENSNGSDLDLTNPNLNLSAVKQSLFDKNSTDSFDFNAALNGASTSSGSQAKTKATMQSAWSGGGGAFEFPIFTDPSNVFALLLGEPATLVKYDMAPLIFDFEWSQFFSIWGPLGVSVNIGFGAEFDFAFGFDTQGISDFVEGNYTNPAAILNGFYVDDLVDGQDVPEVLLWGELWAAAELNLGVARAGVGGGIGAIIEFDLFDPNRDGKVRITELVGNVENQLNAPTDAEKALAPLAIFDVHGEIYAELFAFLKIDLAFWEVDKKFPITDPITLVEFDVDFYRPPKLATELDNGDLILNMGEFAEDRMLFGYLDDISESFQLKKIDATTIAVKSTSWGNGDDANVWQEYNVAADGKIIVRMGEGDDELTIEGSSDLAWDFDIEGGAGNDVINLGGINFTNGADEGSLYATSGDVVVYGDDGDDKISTGEGADWLFGGFGDDIIYAGDGDDKLIGDMADIISNNVAAVVRAGDGNDELHAGGGDDLLIGLGGSDELEAGSGNDILIGDGARVIMDGAMSDWGIRDTERGFSIGNDELLGGDDNDRLYGGMGDDNLDGGAGSDELFAGTGNDVAYGGSCVDFIDGGDGNDHLHGFRLIAGEAAIAGISFNFAGDTADNAADAGDLIYGRGGDDYIWGGDGDDSADLDDVIYAGTGDDEIRGGSGQDLIYGDKGHDLIYGGDEVGGEDVGDKIYGGAGDDEVHGGAGYDDIYAGIGSDTLYGDAGGDHFHIGLLGGKTNSLTQVFDDGDPADGEDIVEVTTTNSADTILLRATVNTDNAFIAMLNDYDALERVNYNVAMESFVINSMAGDDVIALDDTRAIGSINMGIGDDFIQIGQVFYSPRDYANANVANEDKPEVIETSRGYLTNGVSFDLTVNGGIGNDNFVVYHNKASLVLNGNDGDDNFLIKAFALLGSYDPEQSRMDLSGGGGSDTIQYVVNAPVFINGGDGFDRVTIIGTEFQDDFVITEEGVFGAGLNVNYVNIEGLVVDGAEGDDRFFIQGTDEDVLTEIYGGLGSDTFSVGGDTPAVSSNDLKGHSGLIVHDVESTDANYDGLPATGISANVADNDAPAIVVNTSREEMILVEGGMAISYGVSLTRAPTSTVYVTATAPKLGPEELARGYETIGFVDPDDPNNLLSSITLEFTAANWQTEQFIEVKAIGDGVSEGTADIAITHKVASADDIKNTDADGELIAGQEINWVTANTITVENDAFAGQDLTGAVFTLTSPAGVSKTRVVASNTDDSLTFIKDNWLTRPGLIATDGAVSSSDTDTLTDSSIAAFDAGFVGKFIRIVEGTGNGEVHMITAVNGNTLTIDGTWSEQPVEGSVYEIFDLDGYSYTVTRYDGMAIPIVQMKIIDQQLDATEEALAEVILREVDGERLQLREDQTGEQFEVLLTRAPDTGETVTVTLTADAQVELSYDGDTTSANNRDLVIEFDEFNWDSPILVDITAASDNLIEGFHFSYVTATVSSGDVDQTISESQTFPASDPAANEPDPTSIDLAYKPITESIVITVDGDPLKDAILTEVYGNTILFVSAGGTPVGVGGDIHVEYDRIRDGYDGSTVKRLSAYIADADAPGVMIIQTEGSTDVVEGGVTDTYEVVLTAQPEEGKTVKVWLDPYVTPTSLQVEAQLQLAILEADNPQLSFEDGRAYIEFTSDNWDQPVQVNVSAIDDEFVDGGETKVFAPELHTVSLVQGPLLIHGAGGNGSLAIVGPLMLPGETNIKAATGETVSITDSSITINKQDALDVIGVITLDDLVGKSVEITGITNSRSDDLMHQFRLIADYIDNEDGTITLIVNQDWEVTGQAELADVEFFAITNESANFFADEDEQVDWLIVNDSDSVASHTATLSESTLTDYDINLSGMGMGPATEFGGELFPGGISYGSLEYVEINLGDGDNTVNVNATGNRVDPETGETSFASWTVIRTDRGADTVNVNLLAETQIIFEDLTATAYSDSDAVITTSQYLGADDSLAGKKFYITDGTGQQQLRTIVANTAYSLTLDSNLGEEGMALAGEQGESLFRIFDAADGRIAIDTGDGDDFVYGQNSSLPLIVFGGEGDDVIHGGSGEDILFGDYGRVDFMGETGELITRLGVAPESSDPNFIPTLVNLQPFTGDVASATSNTLTAVDGNAFPINGQYEDGELVGLQVFITSGTGVNQGRIIASNTGNTITLVDEWNVIPDETSTYSIFGQGELQTDGVLRDPTLALSIHTNIGGNDEIHSNGGNDSAFGGAGQDEIYSYMGEDIVFGDNGRIDYQSLTLAEEDYPVFGETAPTTVARIQTIDPEYGDDDDIWSGADSDIVFGGMGSDDIYAGNGNNILFGDDGRIDYAGADFGGTAAGDDTDTSDIDEIVSTSTTLGGGADYIYASGGDDIIVGGRLGDTIDAGNGDNLVIGDSGRIQAASDNATQQFAGQPMSFGKIETTEFGDGGVDNVTTGEGNDIVLGGHEGDALVVGSGENIVLGDDGEITYTGADFGGSAAGDDTDASDIDEIVSSSTAAFGGIDIISSLDGNDLIIGGRFGDFINAGGGHNIVIGDSGRIQAAESGGGPIMPVGKIETTEFGDGGVDEITTGSGEDIVLGGHDGDTLNVGAGNNIVLGDDGEIVFTGQDFGGSAAGDDQSTYDVDEIVSTSTSAFGGVDEITSESGDDIIIGGRFGDSIDAGHGDNLVIGDSGRIQAAGQGSPHFDGSVHAMTLGKIETTEFDDGGVDDIDTGMGRDIVLGGDEGDFINVSNDYGASYSATDDHNIVIGDDGAIIYTGADFGGTAAGDDTDASDIDQIFSTSTTFGGGVDTIDALGGDDIILGGRDDDIINAGHGDNLVIGDSGEILAAQADTPYWLAGQPMTFGQIRTTETGDGGDDVIDTGNGNDIILGGFASDTITSGTDSNDGNDIVLGDNGELIFDEDVDVTFDAEDDEMTVTPTGGTDASTLDRITTISPTLGGNDIIYGKAGSDILIGGTGSDWVMGDDRTGSSGDQDESDIVIGDQVDISLIDNTVTGIETTDRDTEAAGAGDVLIGNHDEDMLIGSHGDDFIDGDIVDGDADLSDDLIFGDQVTLYNRWQENDITSFRFQVLSGDHIYERSDIDDVTGDVSGDVLVTGEAQDYRNSTDSQTDADDEPLVPSADEPSWATWAVVEMDHDSAIEAAAGNRFGDDYIAGNAGHDMIFGQLGSDVIQGDGSIESAIYGIVTGGQALKVVGASRVVDGDIQLTPSGEMGSNGLLIVNASFEAATDGDDYIEGNGGDDVIFGGLGQDDIVGDNSDMFSLDQYDERQPVGSDLIFGGSGERIDRNHELTDNNGSDGDIVYNERHARDADAIAGDNANIYRLVGINGTDTGFLSFNYDESFDVSAVDDDGNPVTNKEDRGERRIIVRAVELLDYTLGGQDYDPTSAADDLGAADEIHGESGDDFIYGMVGMDILFGDSEDDDLIGGYDADWISGGTGQDGILGDDGRIFTSRNSTEGESLFGVAGFDNQELDAYIYTPGKIQQAYINQSGELKKTVDLTPFNLTLKGTPDDVHFDPEFADDILYGGLGSDFMHGGAGDDAISGAEALPEFYDRPTPYYDVLNYEGVRAGEFADYDEYNPLTRLNTFLLNFNADEGEEVGDGIYSDGDDQILGDLGNDWLVGGTGRDHIYGGFGNDLLDADDDKDTNGGLNDIPDGDGDGELSYQDIAYGGAGRDVLIANTGGDRLIDWVGEFNSYLVPFAPFGAATVSRTVQPQLMDYLYDLSESDGADPTRHEDGGDPARNGEPFGELGLVTQKDLFWQDQTGAPDDPQAGNIPGGQRDVLRSADFNDGSNLTMFADSGEWEVSGGALQVTASGANDDAIAVLDLDDQLPSYFEIAATITMEKPKGGWKANSYIIFDYQSETDFKFAGIDASRDKIQLGHRTADGWIVDVETPQKIRPGDFYNVLVAVNGTSVTVVIDGQDYFSHTYAPRVDADGWVYGLNDGLVGFGSNNSQGTLDNIAVQVLPPEYTLQVTEDFVDSEVQFLNVPVSGSWTMAGERYVGEATEQAISLIDLGLAAGTTLGSNSVLDISAIVSTDATSGIVFDYYSANDFKYVGFSQDADTLVIGHYKDGSWVIDAETDIRIKSGVDYELSVAIKGTTVDVSLKQAGAKNWQAIVGHVFSALTIDGQFGLLAKAGEARFDSVTIATNDDAFRAETGEALMAASYGNDISDVLPGGDVIAPVVQAAKQRLIAELDLDNEAIAKLEDITISIDDLPDMMLARSTGSLIELDFNAAGHGWFVDKTPYDDHEFNGPEQASKGQSPAQGDIDLLTALMHEMGHMLGFGHDSDMPFMADTLLDGQRLAQRVEQSRHAVEVDVFNERVNAFLSEKEAELIERFVEIDLDEHAPDDFMADFSLGATTDEDTDSEEETELQDVDEESKEPSAPVDGPVQSTDTGPAGKSVEALEGLIDWNAKSGLKDHLKSLLD